MVLYDPNLMMVDEWCTCLCAYGARKWDPVSDHRKKHSGCIGLNRDHVDKWKTCFIKVFLQLSNIYSLQFVNALRARQTAALNQHQENNNNNNNLVWDLNQHLVWHCGKQRWDLKTQTDTTVGKQRNPQNISPGMFRIQHIETQTQITTASPYF